MKLGPEHIGQKFRLKHWTEGNFFKLIAFTRADYLIGESQNGTGIAYEPYLLLDWLPYEEPKKEVKKVVMSPAIVKLIRYFSSNSNLPRRAVTDLFDTEKQARDFYGDSFISWPAMQLIDGKEVPVQYLVPEEE